VLNQPTMEKLLAMRLQGMVEGLKAQEQDRAINELSFLERLSLLVDQQWSWRENQALARRLKAAKLRGPACVEDIDYRAARGLDKTVVRALAKDSAWVRNHENIFVLGPTGVGKSFIASALAQKACRDGHSALYLRAAALLRDLALARADGSLRHLLAQLGRIDVLVIDDWAMAPLNENERREVWEICEDRYQTRSTILTSQLPVSRWHEQIGDPTIAHGILDRLVHNAHRIEMRGESMRRNVIRRRTRRRNEPTSKSLSARWAMCVRLRRSYARLLNVMVYCTTLISGGFHVPSRIEGGVSVGQ
jgi:DNA replication protein DnaC